MAYKLTISVLALLLSVFFITGCDGGDDGPLTIPVVAGEPPPGTEPMDDAPTSSSIVWTLTDGCNDGEDILARFLEFESGPSGALTGWTWPGGAETYQVGSDGRSLELICTAPGRVICYGAGVSSDSRRYWGVSLDGDQQCDSCCVACGTDKITADPVTLTCNR